MNKWHNQIAVGRVFELKSRSARYPAPCVLIVREDYDGGYPMVVEVDEGGCVGHGPYDRGRSNPALNIFSLRRKDFTSKRIARRRRDLERFDARDIEMIQYGLSVDFTGRIGGGRYNYGIGGMPTVGPVTWTIFWTRFEHWSFEFPGERELDEALRGAWHFEDSASAAWNKGWCHAWITAHECPRQLRRIEAVLRRTYADLERNTVRVVRWHDPMTLHTHIWPIGNPGPAFTGTWSKTEMPGGTVSRFGS